MTGAREPGVPWWASESEAAGLDPDEDPVEAYRQARRSSPYGDEHREGPAGEWVEIATRLVVRAARELSAAARERTGSEHRHEASADTEVCRICPICSLLRALDGARPELVTHLTEAARHLTLAVQAFVDAQAESFGDGDLEHIDVE